MASIQKIFSRRLMQIVLRRNIASSSSLQAVAYDPINPAAIERTEEPASDALAAKEKGSWTDLNKEDKIALYRSQFPLTMVEGEKKEPEAARIVFGVSVGVAVALLFFTYLKTYVGPNPPITLTPEWAAAMEEKRKLYRQNPITGNR